MTRVRLRRALGRRLREQRPPDTAQKPGQEPRAASAPGSSLISASGLLVQQANWLYEQEDKRDQQAQNRAWALFTFTGGLLTLLPKLLLPWRGWSLRIEWVLFVLAIVSGIVTAGFCLSAIWPGAIQGNDINTMRRAARRLQTREVQPDFAALQQLELVLGLERLAKNGQGEQADSSIPLASIRDLASRRVNRLRRALLSLTVTFCATLTLSLFTAAGGSPG